MRIAVDAMGGDNAPDATIKGAVKAINDIKAEVVLIGNKDIINKIPTIMKSISNSKIPLFYIISGSILCFSNVLLASECFPEASFCNSFT